MITIEARNVNDALYYGSVMIRSRGIARDSRNGPVLVAPEPVTTVYREPMERVMLHAKRDANPFFHLVEALWMIAGRNDLATLTQYVKNMANFSDDGGKTQPGAYGHRWRKWFQQRRPNGSWAGPRDQLSWAVKRLQADPNDRRVVIGMYDVAHDQEAADQGGKDIPCNLIAIPSVGVDGRLNLTVYNRSNDMIWGAYGANAVHFSVLQEVIAAALGIQVGSYWQVANNFHAYEATLGKAEPVWPWGWSAGPGPWGDKLPDPYERGDLKPLPIAQEGFRLQAFTEDVEVFLDDPCRVGQRNEFLRKIGCPMVMAHRAYKAKDFAGAREILQQMPENNDWRAGAELWLNNREAALKEN